MATSSAAFNTQIEPLQRSFQGEMEKLKKLQKRYQKLIGMNAQLDTQLNENMMVQEELTLTNSDSKVFKLSGRVLVPQSLSDAKSNVERRMKFIEEEAKRNNEQIEKLKSEIETQRETLGGIEKQLQTLFIKSGLAGAAPPPRA